MKRLAALSAAALLAGGAALGAITAPQSVLPAAALASPEATATASPSPSPSPDCGNLQPGDAWAGVSLQCPTPTPTATATATAEALPPIFKGVEPASLPTPTPHAEPDPGPVPSEAAPADKQEDEPGWECYLDGNRICGPKSAESATEAWELFNPGVFTEDELMQPFRVTYHGTVMQGVDLPPSEWYTVPSSEAGIDHAFEIEWGVSK